MTIALMWIAWGIIMTLILTGQNPLQLMGSAGTKVKEIGGSARAKLPQKPKPLTHEEELAIAEKNEADERQRDNDRAHEIRQAELNAGMHKSEIGFILTTCRDENCETCHPKPKAKEVESAPKAQRVPTTGTHVASATPITIPRPATSTGTITRLLINVNGKRYNWPTEVPLTAKLTARSRGRTLVLEFKWKEQNHSCVYRWELS